jgi:hypothetical protein
MPVEARSTSFVGRRMAHRLSIAEHCERLVYRMAGLPVALSAVWLASQGADLNDPAAMDAVFAAQYWHPQGLAEFAELVLALIAWPIGLVGGSLWYTARNGQIVRSRTGKGIATQLREQLRLYFSAGVLAPWYYLFSLDEDSSAVRARTFLQRFETKPVLFTMLKRRKGSPLNDKGRFAEYCKAHGIRCVDVLMQLDGNPPAGELPEHDLFVKPAKGRGGRGAERWDRTASGMFVGPESQAIAAEVLLERLIDRSRREPLVIQPRLSAHPRLRDVTVGALPTVRVVTCLNEAGEPEVIGAVFRMSIGTNRTVDNLHAGGIAAAVDLESGRLSRATNLGTDAHLGWLSVHPDTNAEIEGRALPRWDQVKRIAVDAHRAFADRVVIGWDIAILEDGPILVEGNGNPDMDIIQRFMRVGLRGQRFGQLVAFHLRHRPLRAT